MHNYSPLVVSCVGRYESSGFGTGGLVCLHRNQCTVIDTLDCTGLWVNRNRIYRYVRGLGLLIGYGTNGVESLTRLSESRDVHSILVEDDEITCVSTGTNDIIWFDLAGHIKRKWHAPGTGDAWHLNSLFKKDGSLFVSAFGEFEQHRGWNGQSRGTGFVMNIDTLEKVVSNLHAPHNPYYIDDSWFVCDSMSNSIRIQSHAGERVVPARGFTRGFAHDADYFYVGQSANRKEALQGKQSSIAILKRTDCQLVDEIPLPFCEVFDISVVPEAHAESMTSDPSKFHFQFLDHQVLELDQRVQSGDVPHQTPARSMWKWAEHRGKTASKALRIWLAGK